MAETEAIPIGALLSHTVGGGWGFDDYEEGLLPVRVIRGADFPTITLRRLETAPLRYEPPSKVESRQLRVDDIVIEISGGTKDRPTGRTVLITGDLLEQAQAPVIPASFCRLLRVDPAKANGRFIYYLLQEAYARGGTWEYQNQSTGLSNFQFELFRTNFMVNVPSLAEQRAIADVLTALDDKIAANTQMVQAADQLASAIVSSAIDPSRMVHLAEIAEVTMGSSPPGTSYNEEAVGAVFYQGVRDFGVRFPANRVWTNAPVRMARAGDTLVSVRAPVGEVNLAAEDTCIGRGLASVRSRTAAPMSLFHILKDAPELWAPYEAEGTVFGSINRSQLEGLLVPTIVDGRESKTEGYLAALGNRVALALTENTALTATRDALLPALMSGRLRVRDAAERIGSVRP